MASILSKRWLYRLSAAVVFLLAIRLFAIWLDIKAPVYTLSTGPSYAGNNVGKPAHISAALSTPITITSTTAAVFSESTAAPTETSTANSEDITYDEITESEETEESEEVEDTAHGNLTDVLTVTEELHQKVGKYVNAIFGPNDTSTDRLSCPQFNADRYAHLRVPAGQHLKKYFFALNLRQCADLLPRLMGSIVEAMQFLGPQNIVLSIVEGNSDDGTLEILSALKTDLVDLGVRYYLRRDGLNPLGGDDRIGNLALLRSMAVEPLRNSRNASALALELPGADLNFDDDAVVVFLNDVAACPEDILELLHQRIVQEADMTCAMDWYHPGGPDGASLFYDVWISRTLSGNTFFDINTEGSWEKSESLFPYDADVEARVRFSYHRPFQVFACWNGGVTFTAKPILDNDIDFRRAHDPECFQGEPQLFCKDMWFHGHGRIAVIPSVNLEYTNERGQWIKQSRGYVHQWAVVEDQMEGAPPKRIDWKGPPEEVKCAPTWKAQSWRLWNESLPLVYGI